MIRNTVRTIILFVAIFLLFQAVGALLAYIFNADITTTLLMFFIIAFMFNFTAYLFSDKIVLWSYRAKIVDRSEAPELYSIVEEVAGYMGLPAPKVAIIPTDIPNAFATGRNPRNAVVAVTKGLLRVLDRRELRGVIAHELAHIKNRDTLIMTISATVASAIAYIARILYWSSIFKSLSRSRDEGGAVYFLLAIIAAITVPIAAMLIHLAISRTREYEADYRGATAIRDPISLARALEKIENYVRIKPLNYGNPATSHLFIVNPFRKGSLVTLFSTHPPTEDRIKRLYELARKMGYFV
ncbi:MAG: zinc metalloprotease HtpX [Euryarchaeota archaeon]|nr:zinc metalloprotease HtpX [Euryarchaeota archaeon]